MTPSTQKHDHEYYMRKAFDVARQAKERGDHPFGCVLISRSGEILMEQGNGFVSEGRDMTAHGERLMATRASKAYSPKFLAECTLYVSAEPCAMCSGAIYWAGIGRLVFGLFCKRHLRSFRRMVASTVPRCCATMARVRNSLRDWCKFRSSWRMLLCNN
jgi:tRNA(Arg) A34 adenosine deaminase TadA